MIVCSVAGWIELNWLRLWLNGRFVLLVLNLPALLQKWCRKPHSKHSITKTEELILFTEIITLYWESHIKHINTGFGQNKMFLDVQACGIYIVIIVRERVKKPFHVVWMTHTSDGFENENSHSTTEHTCIHMKFKWHHRRTCTYKVKIGGTGLGLETGIDAGRYHLLNPSGLHFWEVTVSLKIP
jgi:hypothetical protein